MERGESGQCRQERLLRQDRVAGKRGSWRGQVPKGGTQARGALAQTSMEEADGQWVWGGRDGEQGALTSCASYQDFLGGSARDISVPGVRISLKEKDTISVTCIQPPSWQLYPFPQMTQAPRKA